MTRRISLISDDNSFENLVKTTALTLTKLNYQVDIFGEIKKDIDLVVLDFDNPENINIMKNIRKNPSFKNKKTVGVATELTNKKTFFEAGCDSVMSKKELSAAINNILMF